MTAMTDGNRSTVRRRSPSKVSRRTDTSKLVPSSDNKSQKASPANGAGLLQIAIETELIPRLLLVMKHAQASIVSTPANSSRELAREAVPELFAALLSGHVQVAEAIVDRLKDRGVSQADALFDLLAPVARRFGEYWEADLCSFVDVTLAVGSLQMLIRRLTPEREEYRFGDSPRILLLPATGEQHTFPLLILDAMFTRAGWMVERHLSFERDAVRACQRRMQPHCIAVSVSCEHLLDRLASDIDMIRRTDLEQSVKIMVGGAAFHGRPDRVAMVGADGTARDAREAVHAAQDLNMLSAAR